MVIATVEQNLGREAPQPFGDEVRLLVSEVEGALLNGDDDIVARMLERQGAFLSAHSLDIRLSSMQCLPPASSFSELGAEVLSRAADD